MKIYARQINPEFQESPLDYCDLFFDNIVVYGNRDYKKHTLDIFDNVLETLESGELASILEDIKESQYNNATEAIIEFLPPTKEKYSNKDIHLLKKYIEEYSTCRKSDESKIICNVLSIVDWNAWDYMTIRGSMQCEWNDIYYPISKWSKEALRSFEVEYFNEGTEWIIHDGEEIPLNPEEIDGYSTYCISYREEDIRKEIAECAGVEPKDVVLYAFKGYRKTPIYEEVTA